jgi:hypothetical protein
MVVASHPEAVGRAFVEVQLDPGAEREVRLTLARGLAVAGRVVDGSGALVVGAELWVDGALAAISDARGRFTLRRPPGAVDVEVRARGHAPATRRIEAPADHDVDIALGAPTGRVTGVVVDGRGFPVAHARVAVAGAGERRAAETDREGAFSVDGFPSGPLTVEVAHGEHLRSTVLGVAPGDDVRVTLTPGGAVEGEVGEERGGVPAGARVVVVDALGQRRSGAVDASGRFRVTGCAPGPAEVSAEAGGCLPATATVDLPAADWAGEVVLRDVRFALQGAGAVAGTVRDDHGLPVAGAEVEVAGQRVRTDGSGRFRVAAIPVGPADVSVHAGAGEGSERVTVERGAKATVEVRLH